MTKENKNTKWFALAGLLIVVVVGLIVATVPEVRDPIMNMIGL